MYPVILDVRGRRVLVVGGGRIAARKAAALVAEQADVRVVAPDISDEMVALPVRIERRAYRTSDMDGCWLVIAATDDDSVQQRVFEDGEQRGVWVNAVDQPERCSFILPAVHRDGPVLVAVSTSGQSPALAGWLRDRCRDALPERTGELANELAERRRTLKAAGASTEGVDWRAEIEERVRAQQP